MKKGTLKQAFINLLKVKSLITLAIVGAYIFLSITQVISPEAFAGVAGSILTYYFHRETKDKKSNNEMENSENE